MATLLWYQSGGLSDSEEVNRAARSVAAAEQSRSRCNLIDPTIDWGRASAVRLLECTNDERAAVVKTSVDPLANVAMGAFFAEFAALVYASDDYDEIFRLSVMPHLLLLPVAIMQP